MSGLNSPMILLQTRCLGSCGLLTMTMSPRDRVLNNELVMSKVNKVKFDLIHDFFLNETCSCPIIQYFRMLFWDENIVYFFNFLGPIRSLFKYLLNFHLQLL